MTTISPRLPRLVVALVALVGTSCATLTGSSTAPTHRALVIGIDRYSIDADPTILEARGLRDLRGAVRDATTMADVLRARGYAVRTLTDEQATRAALLDAVDRHLVTPTRPGDDVVFFFAGHGSKLPTGDRREVDGQDETLVPVDATRGVPDLRDDTLRRRLRPILDRGGRLTVILDACYSGAATRGLPPERRTRSAAPPRFVASLIPTTEPTSLLERGDLEAGDTLILAAAQDHQEAHETDGPTPRGVFTEALLRALGSAAPDEDAATTLRRAATRMAS
ncbi:MAG: caspase family protein, partial [Acidobacteriota bacterium]